MNDYEKILQDAREQEDVLGFILVGSRGKGFENEHSDYDAVIVVRDDSEDAFKNKWEDAQDVDLSVYGLSAFKKYAGWESPEQWDRYNYAHIKIFIDKTGELPKLCEEKGYIPQEKLAKFIDW